MIHYLDAGIFHAYMCAAERLPSNKQSFKLNGKFQKRYTNTVTLIRILVPYATVTGDKSVTHAKQTGNMTEMYALSETAQNLFKLGICNKCRWDDELRQDEVISNHFLAVGYAYRPFHLQQ